MSALRRRARLDRLVERLRHGLAGDIEHNPGHVAVGPSARRECGAGQGGRAHGAALERRPVDARHRRMRPVDVPPARSCAVGKGLYLHCFASL